MQRGEEERGEKRGEGGTTTIDDNARLLDICEENQRIEQTDIVELTPDTALSEIEITFEADSEDDPVCDALEGRIIKVPVVIRRPPSG
jgi:hypothetical protein